MAECLRPKALRPGDRVAVAALSGGLEEAETALYERGVEAVKSLGFTVHISRLVDVKRRWWWAVARPQEVADELNRLLRDPEVRGIFALTGGRLALSYLDLVDYAAVEVDPKPVLGFSDISALHLALHARTGLVSLHANLVTYGFGEWADLDEHNRTQMINVYRRVLTEDRAPGPLPCIGEWECWRPGRAAGPLVGGLLNRVIRVQATPFAVPADRFDGAILFWEELSSSTSALWNDLHILRQAGILDRVAGMIVGIPTAIDPTEGGPATVREVVLDVVGQRDIPVLGNFDIGHSATNVPMPLGVRAELDADRRTVSLAEAVVTAS